MWLVRLHASEAVSSVSTSRRCRACWMWALLPSPKRHLIGPLKNNYYKDTFGRVRIFQPLMNVTHHSSARSLCPGCYSRCHARRFTPRCSRRYPTSRSSWKEKNYHSWRYHLGDWLYPSMCGCGMYHPLYLCDTVTHWKVEPWYARRWSYRIWIIRRNLFSYCPNLPVRNNDALASWSYGLPPAMVDHLGHSHSILHSIWLLLYQRCCILPHSLGSSNDTSYRSQFRNVGLPRIPSFFAGSWIVSNQEQIFSSILTCHSILVKKKPYKFWLISTAEATKGTNWWF